MKKSLSIWSPYTLFLRALSSISSSFCPFAGAAPIDQTLFPQAPLPGISEHPRHDPPCLLWSAYLRLLPKFFISSLSFSLKEREGWVTGFPYLQSKTINLYPATNKRNVEKIAKYSKSLTSVCNEQTWWAWSSLCLRFLHSIHTSGGLGYS